MSATIKEDMASVKTAVELEVSDKEKISPPGKSKRKGKNKSKSSTPQEPKKEFILVKSDPSPGRKFHHDNRSRHHNAPPPISLKKRNAQGPLPSFDDVQKGKIFDYVGLMEAELNRLQSGHPGMNRRQQRNSAHQAYDTDFPPLAQDSNVKNVKSSKLDMDEGYGYNESSLQPYSYEHNDGDSSFRMTPAGFISNPVYDQSSLMVPQPAYFQYESQSPVYLMPISYPPINYSMQQMSRLREDHILKQIEFYFSPANLKKDKFMTGAMDAEGYLPLITIIGFPKVQALTNDIALITRILQNSTEVELDALGLKVRPRRNWEQWLSIPGDDKDQPEANHSQVQAFIIELAESEDEQHKTDTQETGNQAPGTPDGYDEVNALAEELKKVKVQ